MLGSGACVPCIGGGVSAGGVGAVCTCRRLGDRSSVAYAAGGGYSRASGCPCAPGFAKGLNSLMCARSCRRAPPAAIAA
jgi:hypothetical protein